MAEACYVYILRCADNSLYSGYTVDLDKRISAHRAGKASKYTRSRLPVELVYWEVHSTKSSALSREAELKKLTHKEKAELAKAFNQTNL